ncbi:tachykinin-like peptides receptor 86C [Diadema antillarum]|uniref:tachykinin-like peptides receptor 86C n=1 Tax=Diadema antillarum TaxID=105358 RepID=UPI003A8701BF
MKQRSAFVLFTVGLTSILTRSAASTTQVGLSELDSVNNSDVDLEGAKPTNQGPISTDIMSMNPTTVYDYIQSAMESTEESLNLPSELPADTLKGHWVWSFEWSWTNILYTVFSFVGIVGNMLVLLALLKHSSTRHAPDIFIGALAFADLLTSIFILPVPRARSVPDSGLGSAYCSFIFTRYPMWVCIHASIYTLTGMSLERFMAVVYPLRVHRRLTRRHVFIYLAVVWVLCFPSCFHFLSIRVINNVCRNAKTPDGKKITAFYPFLFRVGIPSLTMIITQGLTAMSLHRQSREMSGSRFGKGGTQPSIHIMARNRVVKLTFIVVLIYIFTVGPNDLQVEEDNYHEKEQLQTKCT